MSIIKELERQFHASVYRIEAKGSKKFLTTLYTGSDEAGWTKVVSRWRPISEWDQFNTWLEQFNRCRASGSQS